MTISVWRYSHFALAVSSFLFITLAAVTGIVLSFEPITGKVPSYKADHFNQLTLAETIPALKRSFSSVTSMRVDANQFVVVKGTDTSGKALEAYVDPSTGKVLGTPHKQHAFYQWVTALHRSLFLHEAGRFFVGLTSFLLLLIAISGTVLVIRRQRGWKRFFTRIVKDNFAQYYHVVLGRLSLIPIILIALTGTWLSMARFGLLTEKKVVHHIDENTIREEPVRQPAAFPVFKQVLLSQVQTVDYPFSEFPEDYYTLKLKDREIVVNQLTGEKLSEVIYPVTTTLSRLSLDWHTGRVSILWAIVLAIACLNILFFIYSGFAISLKRLAGRSRNKYKPEQCRFIILAGSENGSTMAFAKALQGQLIANGEMAYCTDLNNYQTFPQAEHIIILTSTYGLGDAPANANRFASLVKKYQQQPGVHFSVVGFGSHAYPDFCQFAFEVNNLLSLQPWALPLLEIHTINDKSPDQFNQWLVTWSQKVGLTGIALPETMKQKPAGLETMTVIEKTAITHADEPFIVRIKPSWRNKYTSGDLLAVYPADDYRERLYSIGKVGGHIQLSVKRHPDGLGSTYLYHLRPGDTIQARVVPNPHFLFPQQAPAVIMISNGTGIAPFLGMIEENNQLSECYLYCGFRYKLSFEPFAAALNEHMAANKLDGLQVAYSREEEKQYVKDLLANDADFVAQTLARGGVLMLCGSLSMQHDIIAWLETVCQERNGKSISHYQSHGQVLMDCY
ncbi:FAD-binding oxidoreductase [Paraflavitalea soli]|uniref:FAD-binding oxidoreductase n=1 Tax=Paraflavitalea soli TaxID=2315862 RepID=A0A3B7MGL7_9BACT|nr:PepSY domain-containing protein [Paraflavitalea soli]AXY72737.1 FAD-binding oxidoreductase [Paraflavitalea soli]